MEENIEISTENEEMAAAEQQDKKPENDGTKMKKFLSDVLEIAESTITTVFVMILIFTYLLHPVNVVGNSMYPTLKDGDRIFMSTVYFGLKYGDIVIINNDASYLLDENGNPYKRDLENNPLKECIIKRVIACEGQTLEIDNSDPNPENWFVRVDGEILNEPYLARNATTQNTGEFADKFPLTVPEGYYFVMGDNRRNSTDSRSSFVGLIKKEQIYGKAVLRYSPFSEIKFLLDSYKKSSDE